MQEAAILDFGIKIDEVPPNFRVVTSSGSVPVEISSWDLGNPDFPVQMECTISNTLIVTFTSKHFPQFLWIYSNGYNAFVKHIG